MSLLRLAVLASMTVSMAVAATAQQRQNPAFADPKVDPSLPNVLLIGDSISIGYMVDAREAMKGKANVFRPATNCGPTTRGLENIDSWLGDRKWDVVHWNFGLHDLKFMGPGGENLADPKAAGSHRQVPIEEYQANIAKLAERIKQSAGIVIWRETSPVPQGAAGRISGDSARYNAAAADAIAKVGGIQTDPFFAYAESISDLQRPKNVHYTPEGSKKLGEHVAEVVLKALDSRN
ncbi:SGNH/GDSL hydrolase family protein [Roseiconus nitratireducens]|uniref:SGNH/GDSL hydrolase family protein n=1 Tax=Roseiconus nitratireducens TaxID=2605748 RepID=A0A5M6DA80_9BACT|nr:SGNH/GDSL hydrolase family protein [Roseiconus nitratireducens]KAA5542105.1 SGNH/GDSL hydrolase family protein [Roseiconus nitratireducens]